MFWNLRLNIFSPTYLAKTWCRIEAIATGTVWDVVVLRAKRWKLCLLHCKRQQCLVQAFGGDFVDLGPSGAADFGGALILLPHSTLFLLYTVDKYLVFHTFSSTRSVHVVSTRGLLESGIP